MERIGTYIKRGLKYILHGQPTVFTTAKIVTVQPSQQLSDKKILITGGSKGIGFAWQRSSLLKEQKL